MFMRSVFSSARMPPHLHTHMLTHRSCKIKIKIVVDLSKKLKFLIYFRLIELHLFYAVIVYFELIGHSMYIAYIYILIIL